MKVTLYIERFGSAPRLTQRGYGMKPFHFEFNRNRKRHEREYHSLADFTRDQHILFRGTNRRPIQVEIDPAPLVDRVVELAALSVKDLQALATKLGVEATVRAVALAECQGGYAPKRLTTSLPVAKLKQPEPRKAPAAPAEPSPSNEADKSNVSEVSAAPEETTPPEGLRVPITKYTRELLTAMTVAELKVLAKEFGVYTAKLRTEPQLIEALLAAQE